MAARAAATNSRMRAGSFTPRLLSTPELTSTPNGRTCAIASATLVTSRPPASTTCAVPASLDAASQSAFVPDRCARLRTGSGGIGRCVVPLRNTGNTRCRSGTDSAARSARSSCTQSAAVRRSPRPATPGPDAGRPQRARRPPAPCAATQPPARPARCVATHHRTRNRRPAPASAAATIALGAQPADLHPQAGRHVSASRPAASSLRTACSGSRLSSTTCRRAPGGSRAGRRARASSGDPTPLSATLGHSDGRRAQRREALEVDLQRLEVAAIEAHQHLFVAAGAFAREFVRHGQVIGAEGLEQHEQASGPRHSRAWRRAGRAPACPRSAARRRRLGSRLEDLVGDRRGSPCASPARRTAPALRPRRAGVEFAVEARAR